MGCSYPIKIENKKFKDGGIYKYQRIKYFYVPCGKCLGCQISKRTWLNTACEYEFNKYGIGSFTTLTYDQEHLLKNYDEATGLFKLNYKDFQNFMKRLRQNLYRKYGVRHEFKYLAVGEYGGESGRIHWHVLFFGLDCKNNDLDIYNAWEQGIAQNLPIKRGGINYVLKYLDKSEIRKKNRVDFTADEEPCLFHSAGLGKGFIEENLEDIIEHHGTYDRGDGKRHSLPKYWCNKLRIETISNYNDMKREMVKQGYKGVKNWQKISKAEVLNWQMEQNRIKECQMIRKSRQDGIPQEDFDYLAWETAKRNMN